MIYFLDEDLNTCVNVAKLERVKKQLLHGRNQLDAGSPIIDDQIKRVTARLDDLYKKDPALSKLSHA